jgi:Holliday junction resolvase RusA-like endonuclease
VIRLTIPFGALASDNTRNKRRGGKAHSSAYKESRDAIYLHALNQIRGERPAIAEGPIEVRFRFYPPNWRHDQQSFFKVILDSLQGVAYANDRQLRSLSHLVVDVDRENPRCEVTISRWLESEVVSAADSPVPRARGHEPGNCEQAGGGRGDRE